MVTCTWYSSRDMKFIFQHPHLPVTLELGSLISSFGIHQCLLTRYTQIHKIHLSYKKICLKIMNGNTIVVYTTPFPGRGIYIHIHDTYTYTYTYITLISSLYLWEIWKSTFWRKKWDGKQDVIGSWDSLNATRGLRFKMNPDVEQKRTQAREGAASLHPHPGVARNSWPGI